MTGLFCLFYLCEIDPKMTLTVLHYGGSADIFVTGFRDRVKQYYPCYFSSSPVPVKINKESKANRSIYNLLSNTNLATLESKLCMNTLDEFCYQLCV